MQTRSTSRSAPVAELDPKNASDFSDVNAFDRNIWLGLYHDIDKPAAAQAVLEMSETLPILVKLYPALLVRARQTLIHHEQKRTRQSAWQALALRLFMSLLQKILDTFKATSPASRVREKAPIFLKYPR